MKKTYKKPEIAFDSFEMSVSIAAGCKFISNHAEMLCAIDLGDDFGSIFTDSNNECSSTQPSLYDMVCYQAPSDNTSVFTS